MFGPLIVIGTGIFLVVLCCFFCSVDPSAPHRTKKKKVVVEDETGKVNHGFERDDVSRTSRRTVETDLGDDEKTARKKKTSTKKSDGKTASAAAAKKKKQSKRSQKNEKRREPRRIVNVDQSGPSDEATRRNIDHLMKLASADQVDETTG